MNHVHRQYSFGQPELKGIDWCIFELLRVSNNEIYLPGFTKTDVNTYVSTPLIRQTVPVLFLFLVKLLFSTSVLLQKS